MSHDYKLQESNHSRTEKLEKPQGWVVGLAHCTMKRNLSLTNF
jgi:hypothetical protein